MGHFDDETDVRQTGPTSWIGHVSPNWSIGSVPNGGYVLALALSAVRQAVAHPHPLTVTGHFLRPCDVGPVRVDVEVVRKGRTVSTAAARIVQDDKERLLVLAGYGDLSTAVGPTVVSTEAPALPPPEDCIGRAQGLLPPGGSDGIVSRVEFRIDPGHAGRLSGQTDRSTAFNSWVRFADGREPDVHSLPLFVDALPPAVFGAVAPQWVPTVELTTHVRALPSPGWLRAAVSTRFLIDGAFEEDCELWDSAGRLVAQSRQLARLLSA